MGIFRNEEEERSHICKFLKVFSSISTYNFPYVRFSLYMKYKCYLFLKDDLEVDPELLKGTDRMKAQGIGAPICVCQSQKILFIPSYVMQVLSN